MRDVDVGWAAGFMEGDGTFYSQAGKKGSTRRYFKVVAWQVDSEPLEKMKSLFGGRICKVKRSETMRKDGYARQDIHYWEIKGSDAITFLNLIYPHLSARRKAQVDKMVDEVGDRFGSLVRS